MKDKPTSRLLWMPANTTNLSEPTNKSDGFIQQVLYSKWLNWIIKTISEWLDYVMYKEVDLYVNNDTGDDGNDGLTPGNPLLTINQAIDLASQFGNATIHLMADGDSDIYYNMARRVNLKGSLTITSYAGNPTNLGVLQVEMRNDGGKKSCYGFNLYGQSNLDIDTLYVAGAASSPSYTYNTNLDNVVYCADSAFKKVSIFYVFTSSIASIGSADTFKIINNGGTRGIYTVLNMDIADNTAVYAICCGNNGQILLSGNLFDTDSQYFCYLTIPVDFLQKTICKIWFDADGTAGTFTLTINNQTTATIAYNASTATVKAAVDNLTGLGVCTVSLNAGATDCGDAEGFTITFDKDDKDVLVTAVNIGSLGGATKAYTQHSKSSELSKMPACITNSKYLWENM